MVGILFDNFSKGLQLYSIYNSRLSPKLPTAKVVFFIMCGIAEKSSIIHVVFPVYIHIVHIYIICSFELSVYILL